MRLYELFEDPFTPPGISYVLNDPQDEPAAGKGYAQNMSQNQAGPNDNQPQSQVRPYGPMGGMSSSGGSNTGNTTPVGNAVARQVLSKGSPIVLPVGPTNTPTNMKISNVSQNDSSKGKTVTLTNPQKPNDPAQTYKYDDLAKIVGQTSQQNGNV